MRSVSLGGFPSVAFFHWSDEMSVGVREIDAQHRRLISLTNFLVAAMLTGKRREPRRAAVAAVLSYAAVHFSTEEAYMRAFGYDDYEEHRLQHSEFTRRAQELRDRADRDGLSLETIDFLGEWLRHHIQFSDKGYESLFRSRGLR